MKKIEIKKGDRCGRLIILKEKEQRPRISGRMKRYVECQCDCGKIKVIRLDSLRSGVTKSCGCYLNEIRGRSSMTHRMSKSREFKSWQSMKNRCLNKNAPNYKRYGGSGISVCHRWINSFENFYKDMGKRPIGTSIDRINGNNNYEPNNCKWSTPKQQNNNLKSNVIITYKNETMNANDWSKRLGRSRTVVSTRLLRGWSIEKALTTKKLK